MPLTDLRTVPAPLAPVGELLGVLDDALVAGFGRLSSAHLEGLAALARSFHGTPLADALQAAVAGLGRAEFLDRHFAVLAAARGAALGAVHDALVAQASAALARPAPALADLPAAPAQAAPPRVAVLLESVRQWLMELAIAGLANLEIGALLPFQATLDAIMGEPSLVRHAALLSGFLGELLTVFPAHAPPEVPRQRWADLWSRAMLLALAPLPPTAARSVSGELRVFATDLRQHDNLANLVVYGALHEPGKPPQLVRAAVSAFKVDVLQGDDLGGLLGDLAGNLLAAIAGAQALRLDGVPLLATGDLVWNDARASVQGKFKPLDEAAAVLAAAPAQRPCLAPADRHPALIEELVHLPGDAYTFDPKHPTALALAGRPFPLAGERVPSGDDLRVDDLAGSKALVALLRFDAGQWSLQPVAVDKGKPLPRMAGTGLAAARGKKRGSNLETLQERAGKLLRKKS
jgi:hypothetical protein